MRGTSRLFLSLLIVVGVLVLPASAGTLSIQAAEPELGTGQASSIQAQRHSLTCEAAATASAARTAGWAWLDEESINDIMPSSWDPKEGFVGNIDGWQTASLAVLQRNRSAGYVVEAPAVQKVLASLGIDSFYMEGGEFAGTVNLLHQYRLEGYGVVIWGTTRPWLPHAVYNSPYRFVDGEHAYEFIRLTTNEDGYVDGALVGDPLDGSVWVIPIGYVERMMGYFGNMALIIEPPGRGA